MCDTNVNYAEIALSIGSPTLGMFPSSVMMLGGDNIFIAGPCFEPSNVIVCEFPGGKIDEWKLYQRHTSILPRSHAEYDW